jgi:hypothetical protein
VLNEETVPLVSAPVPSVVVISLCKELGVQTAALDPTPLTIQDEPLVLVRVPPVNVIVLVVPEVPVVVLNPIPAVTQLAVLVAAVPL